MLLVFFTLTVFMLVSMLEVQKGCNMVLLILVFLKTISVLIIQLSEEPPDMLRPKGFG